MTSWNQNRPCADDRQPAAQFTCHCAPQRSVESSLRVEPLHSIITYGRWTFFIQRFYTFFYFYYFFTFFNVFYFFSERCYIYGRHEYQLPKCSSDLHQRSYIVHSLYSLISFCQSHFIQSIPGFNLIICNLLLCLSMTYVRHISITVYLLNY